MNGGGLYRGARFEKESVTEKIVGAAKRVVKGSGKQTVQVRDSWWVTVSGGPKFAGSEAILVCLQARFVQMMAKSSSVRRGIWTSSGHFIEEEDVSVTSRQPVIVRNFLSFCTSGIR